MKHLIIFIFTFYSLSLFANCKKTFNSYTRKQVSLQLLKEGKITEEAYKALVRSRKSLKKMCFSNTNLSYFNLSCRNLSDTVFTNAQLASARIKKSNLKRANFHNAYLKNANFTGSDLREASFKYTDLRGANLKNIRLHNTDFFRARYDSETKLPRRFNPQKNHMIKIDD